MTPTNFTLPDILASDANVILQVSAKDLKEFAQDILVGAKSVAMIEAEAAATSDQLLTIDEASELLSVSKMTLYRWDQNGILKKVEIGGKRRYSAASVATAKATSNVSSAVKSNLSWKTHRIRKASSASLWRLSCRSTNFQRDCNYERQGLHNGSERYHPFI